MNIIQSCMDTSDVTPLFPQQGLYLKPVAKLNISVHLPTLKLPGKTISNWEVMEKLKYWAIPNEFTSLKVSKNTLEFIRFDAEIESRSKLHGVLARLDGRSIKLSGFNESMKVRAAEAKADFPTRHTWDSYFRDAKNMNEMKPGERPDTIHLSNLPCQWFASKSDPDKPSEYVLRKVFETFGEVRCVDIPMIDPYRNRMKAHISGVKMFSHSQNIVFEAYVQFKEYICFVKAMDALRSMKLVHKENSMKVFSASISVDFDKTKHLSDSSIRKRRVEREKLMNDEREKEEQERLAREREEAEKEAERKRKQKEKEDKLERRRLREEKRKMKQLEKLKVNEAEEMNRKIATEERLLIMAQRRLESIRLLGELFRRVEEGMKKRLEEKKKSGKHGEKLKLKGKEGKKNNKKIDLKSKEEELRQKLVSKMKAEKLKKDDGSSKIKGILATSPLGKSEESSDDMSSISSLDSLSIDDNKGKIEKEPIDDSIIPNRFHDMNRDGHPPWYSRGAMGGYGQYGASYSRRMYFPRRRGFRWSGYPPRGRGSYMMPPYIDPLYLDINHQYYKYFRKITHGKSRSRSYSRSRSRTPFSSRSRSWSRSSSRSRRRRRRRKSRSSSRRRYSRSRSRSRSSHRSRSTYRSRSRSRRGSKDHHRKRSSSTKRRSRSGSRNNKRSKSRNKSESEHSPVRNEQIKPDRPRKTRWDVESKDAVDSNKNDESKDVEDKKETEKDVGENEMRKSPIRFPSVAHTWSRSPSRSRSLSWEKKRLDDKDKEKKDMKKHKRHHKSKHKKKKTERKDK